LSKRAWDRN